MTKLTILNNNDNDNDNNDNNDNNENIKIEYVYEQVSNNITNIIPKYENRLNPNNNIVTKIYLDEGNDQQTAYALSFTTTLLLYLQICNENITIT